MELHSVSYTAHNTVKQRNFRNELPRYLPALCFCFWSVKKFLLNTTEKRGENKVSFTLVWLMPESQGPRGSCHADVLDLCVCGGMRDISGTHRRRWASCGVDCCSSREIEGRSVSHRRCSRDTVPGSSG